MDEVFPRLQKAAICRLRRHIASPKLGTRGPGREWRSQAQDYRLGKRLLRLLARGSDTAWLTFPHKPILDRLANENSGTCYLARLVGHEVVSVAWATPGSDGLRGFVVPGHTLLRRTLRLQQGQFSLPAANARRQGSCGNAPENSPRRPTKRKDIDKDYRTVRVRTVRDLLGTKWKSEWAPSLYRSICPRGGDL